MASPKYEVVFLYNATTGVPATGLVTLAFDVYKNDLGADLAQPAIVEIGGGAYRFLPTFTANRGIVYVLNANDVTVSPQRSARYMRPEDWNADNADVLSSDLLTLLTRSLGLMHENSVMDQTSFDGHNNITSGRLRTYDTKAHAVAAGATGLLSTYTISATYAGGNVQTYRVVREGS